MDTEGISLTQVVIDGIYHVPLKSPSAMAKDVKSKALALEGALRGVEIKHPLVRWIFCTPLPIRADQFIAVDVTVGFSHEVDT